jgi:hypothetical protein
LASASRTLGFAVKSTAAPNGAPRRRIRFERCRLAELRARTFVPKVVGSPEAAGAAQTAAKGLPDTSKLSPRDWLSAVLRDGPMLAVDIEENRRAAGRSSKSILKASKALKVVRFQQGRYWF